LNVRSARVPLPPILTNKNADAPSVFEPAALLREARRQQGIIEASVPPVCILDPDVAEHAMHAPNRACQLPYSLRMFCS
jgi:hypothetical protein